MMQFSILDWHINTANYTPGDASQYLGRIPLLLDPASSDPAWLQFDTNLPEGWCPVIGEECSKWTFTADQYLIYPGLPPLAPAAMAWLGSEQILVYPAGWVVITNLVGEFTIGRIEP